MADIRTEVRECMEAMESKDRDSQFNFLNTIRELELDHAIGAYVTINGEKRKFTVARVSEFPPNPQVQWSWIFAALLGAGMSFLLGVGYGSL